MRLLGSMIIDSKTILRESRRLARLLHTKAFEDLNNIDKYAIRSLATFKIYSKLNGGEKDGKEKNN